MLRQRLYLGFALVMLFVLGLAAGALIQARVASAQRVADLDALHMQYARGAYDICVALIAPPEMCLAGIDNALHAGVYDMASDGFRWPLAGGARD